VVVVLGEQFDQFVTGALVDQFVVPPDGGFVIHSWSSALLGKIRLVAEILE
jgi:hypothetical protein